MSRTPPRPPDPLAAPPPRVDPEYNPRGVRLGFLLLLLLAGSVGMLAVVLFIYGEATGGQRLAREGAAIFSFFIFDHFGGL